MCAYNNMLREIRKTIAASVLGLGLIVQTPAIADRAPRGYSLLQSNPNHSFRYSQLGEPVRRGKLSERFEIRDGFCYGTDCARDRLRSEIRFPKNRDISKIGQDSWFGWSFRVESFSADLRKIGVYPFLGQWKTAPENSPTLYLIMGGGGGSGSVYLSLGDMARKNNNYVAGAKHGHVCKNMFTIDQAKRQWIDIVINTNFSDKNDGYVNAWVNGRLACKYKGQIVATKTAQDYRPNHRRGIYIGNMKRWRSAKGQTPLPSVVVYYDEFLMGKSREEVDTRLREAAGLPAKD